MISAKESTHKIKKRSLLIGLFVFLLLAMIQRWMTESANDYIDKGNSKLASGDYNGALRDYYYADTLDDSREASYLAKVRRGEIFLEFGKYDEAEKELAEAIKEERRRYEAHELLGDLYGKKRDFDKALNYYNNAIQYNNGSGAALSIGIKRARMFMRKGETDLASYVLKNLYSQAPKGNENKELLFYLGILEFDKNISSNAYLDKLRSDDGYKWKIEKMDSFIGTYDSSHGDVFNNIMVASFYNSIGEPYLAIIRAKKAINADSSYRDAWITLGKSHFITEDYSASLDDLAKALKLDGHNGETFFRIGSVFSKIGNEKLAKEYFSRYEIFR